MKRVLVTGATGFIGRHCLPALRERAAEVHAVSIEAPGEELDGVQWHVANLLTEAEIASLIRAVRPTHLLNLAWYVEPERFWSSPENLRWVQSSITLLRAFMDAGGERFVGAGTCAEYDWEHGFCSEDRTPLVPASLYGVSKHALHLLSRAAAEEAGVGLAWGRVFFLYGPHEPPNRLVSSVVRSLLEGLEAPCTTGEQIRDYLHVEDVAEAFVALLASEVRGAVNIASGEPVRVRELIEAIGESTGRSELLRLGEIPLKAGEPPIVLGDVRRLTEEVGWRPRLDLAEGVSRTVEWWRNRLEHSTS